MENDQNLPAVQTPSSVAEVQTSKPPVASTESMKGAIAETQSINSGHHLRFMLIAALAFLLIALSGSAALVLHFQKKSTPPAITKATPSPTAMQFVKTQISPSPSINQPIDTSNWKTYENTTYGYSFKYPTEWDIISNDSNKLALGFKSQNDVNVFLIVTSQNTEFSNYQSFKFCSQIPDIENHPTHCIEETGWGQKQPVEQITLSAKSALSFYISGEVDYAFHIVRFIQTPTIELDMNVAGGGLDKKFDQILSTFTFTDQTPSITSSTGNTTSETIPAQTITQPPSGYSPTPQKGYLPSGDNVK